MGTTWNQREAAKLGNYWEETHKVDMREAFDMNKSAQPKVTRDKFSYIASQTACG